MPLFTLPNTKASAHVVFFHFTLFGSIFTQGLMELQNLYPSVSGAGNINGLGLSSGIVYPNNLTTNVGIGYSDNGVVGGGPLFSSNNNLNNIINPNNPIHQSLVNTQLGIQPTVLTRTPSPGPLSATTNGTVVDSVGNVVGTTGATNGNVNGNGDILAGPTNATALLTPTLVPNGLVNPNGNGIVATNGGVLANGALSNGALGVGPAVMVTNGQNLNGGGVFPTVGQQQQQMMLNQQQQQQQQMMTPNHRSVHLNGTTYSAGCIYSVQKFQNTHIFENGHRRRATPLELNAIENYRLKAKDYRYEVRRFNRLHGLPHTMHHSAQHPTPPCFCSPENCRSIVVAAHSRRYNGGSGHYNHGHDAYYDGSGIAHSHNNFMPHLVRGVGLGGINGINGIGGVVGGLNAGAYNNLANHMAGNIVV